MLRPPGGLPDEWLGQSVEVYGVPASPSSSVSLALRWHGERPAVLWEQTGGPVELNAPLLAPEWGTSEMSGEALWPVPPNADDATRVELAEPPTDSVPLTDDPPSFG